MASSIVSSMFIILLLLFVFPHIDKTSGAQVKIRKLQKTNHQDQVTVQQGRFPKPDVRKICKLPFFSSLCKGQVPNIPGIPPPPPRRGKKGPGQ